MKKINTSSFFFYRHTECRSFLSVPVIFGTRSIFGDVRIGP